MILPAVVETKERIQINMQNWHGKERFRIDKLAAGDDDVIFQRTQLLPNVSNNEKSVFAQVDADGPDSCFGASLRSRRTERAGRRNLARPAFLSALSTAQLSSGSAPWPLPGNLQVTSATSTSLPPGRAP
jgi:hypothetical protein